MRHHAPYDDRIAEHEEMRASPWMRWDFICFYILAKRNYNMQEIDIARSSIACTDFCFTGLPCRESMANGHDDINISSLFAFFCDRKYSSAILPVKPQALFGLITVTGAFKTLAKMFPALL